MYSHFDYVVNTVASGPSAFDVITTILTIIALGFSGWQTYLSRKALKAAERAIDDDRRTRQLASLPETSWVMQVNAILDIWIRELKNLKTSTYEAIEKKDENLLRKVVDKLPKTPNKIGLPRFLHENAPGPFPEILMSAAQYYYNATSAAQGLWFEGSDPSWSYGVTIQERYDESLFALHKLKELINDMTPDVIANTPASLNDRDFLSD